MMRIFIAGPIAGMPDQNREAFRLKAEEIRRAGHYPVNPHHVDHSHTGDCFGAPTPIPGDPHHYGCYVLGDLQELARCDAVMILPNWEHSAAPNVAMAFARATGIIVLGVGVPPWTL